jgi:hypothetical protein
LTMGRGFKQQGAARGRGPPGPSRGGRGIAKASHASSSSALGAAIAAARTERAAAKAASTANLHLAVLSETAHDEEDAAVDNILELVRECLGESDSMALTALGDTFRTLAMRRALPGLHKQVKDKFGGWEAFFRRHAAGELSVVQGMVRLQHSADGMADASISEAAPSNIPTTSRDEINALSLDGAAL